LYTIIIKFLASMKTMDNRIVSQSFDSLDVHTVYFPLTHQ
jgi:hypothetical protein